MRRSSRGWWLIFASCSAAVIGAMLWITVAMVRLERSEARARADAAHQEALRLALWRMDSWFAPRLAREAARPYVDYQPFLPQRLAYTRMLSQIEEGEVLTPSPLLGFESEFVRLHFQIRPDGSLTSPQVPTGRMRDLAEKASIPDPWIQGNRAALEELGEVIQAPALERCVAAAEENVGKVVETPSAPPPVPGSGGAARNAQEWTKRQKASLESQIEVGQAANDGGRGAAAAARSVGPFVPVWVSAAGTGPAPGAELVFVRRVREPDAEYLQGFLCNWPALRAALLEQVEDLLPEAQLVPVTPPVAPDQGVGAAGDQVAAPARTKGARTVDEAVASGGLVEGDGSAGSKGHVGGVGGVGGVGSMLATIPARLETPPPALPASAALLTPAGSTLAVGWAAVLAGLVAVALTLRSSVRFAEKRSRFASAVTHELRTPLTTFRMYSEMLSKGWIEDETQRRAYLRTLEEESSRLATLVENVLAYARLERGQAKVRRRALTLGGLLDRITPALRRRAESAGMRLEVVSGAADAPLVVDADAVEQILRNLVDNACKYASGGTDPAIDLDARIEGGDLVIHVRDRGPGIAAAHRRSIFAPFDRGARDAGDPAPGVGLGLALARGLARNLGGDLRLAGGEDGACFRLALPGNPRRGGRDAASQA